MNAPERISIRAFWPVAMIHLVMGTAFAVDTLAVVGSGYLGASGVILAPPICVALDDSTVLVSGTDFFTGDACEIALETKPSAPIENVQPGPRVGTLHHMESTFRAARERGESVSQAADRAIARIREDDNVDPTSVVVQGTSLSFRWKQDPNLVMSYDFAKLEPVDAPLPSWRTGMERVLRVAIDGLESGCLVLRGHRYQHFVSRAHVGAVLRLASQGRSEMTPGVRAALVDMTCGGFVADFEKRLEK